jgi:predicted transposase
MQRTIRVKLETTSRQAQILSQTLKEFTTAFNFVCEVGWQAQQNNGVKLHHATYHTVKTLCQNLVSDLIIQARTKATEAVKSALTHRRKHPAKLQEFEKAKQEAEAKGKPFFRKPPKPPHCPRSNLCPARYNLHTYKVNWTNQTVNLATSPGNRLVIGFKVPNYAQKYLGYPTDTADLIYRKGSFWLHIVVTLPDPIPQPQASEEVIGIDLGLNHPAVTSKRKFLGSRHWKEVDRHYFRLKRTLQSKGTKSAKRHLRTRFISDKAKDK